MDLEPLREWFLEEKRDFPWRRQITPYRVWISEVMLQQTRAAVVIPYFERWMELFPTVQDLANASSESVIKAWEGLGYYSRARNLHTAACKIVQTHGGIFPSDREKLSSLQGIGSYTTGAILSFAFRQKAPAVDGNVVRVVARLLALQEDASQKKIYEKKVEELLPEKEPWVAMEAFIELGAIICQKKPLCESCPLREECKGRKEGIAELLPLRKPKPATTFIQRDVAIIFYKDEVLVRKTPLGEVMGGLYEFPYVERGYPWALGLEMEKLVDLRVVKQTFTRFRATLYPAIWKVREKKEAAGYHWLPERRLEELPFSSGHRKICNEYFTYRKL